MTKKAIYCTLYLFILTIFFSPPLAAFENGEVLLTGYGTYLHPQTSTLLSFDTIPDSAVKIEDTGAGMATLRVIFLTCLGLEASAGIAHLEIKGEKSLYGVNIGHTWYAPTTLMLQYYFNPCAKCTFHIGSGVNYSIFYDQKCKIDGTKLNVSNYCSYATQAGMDYIMPGGEWFFSIDAKYLRVQNKATLSGDTSGRIYMNMNPWLLSAGFGRRF